MKRIWWEKWKTKSLTIVLRRVSRKSAAMYGKFAAAESYEKGEPQVATEKTFLSARTTEIAERRNTERDGDCKKNGDWSKPGGEAPVASGFRVAPLHLRLATVTCVVRGSRCVWFPVVASRPTCVVVRWVRNGDPRILRSPRVAASIRNLTGVKWLAFNPTMSIG